MTSKHDGDFYCFNFLHSFRIVHERKSHKKVQKGKDFCAMVMPCQKNDMVQFDQYMKSDNVPYIIYADLKFLTKEIEGCAYNPEKSSTTKIGEHIPCRYLMPTIWAFDNMENKHVFHHEEKVVLKSFVAPCENILQI